MKILNRSSKTQTPSSECLGDFEQKLFVSFFQKRERVVVSQGLHYNHKMDGNKEIVDALMNSKTEEKVSSTKAPKTNNKDALRIIDVHELEDDQVSLGSGNRGSVHRRRWNGHLVAVKTLKDGKVFEREALGVSNSFENVVIVYGKCLIDGGYALVMEYSPLGSLVDVMKNDPQRINEMFVLNATEQLLRAVESLERGGVTHGDVKSENVLVFDGPVVCKLCDFSEALVDAPFGKRSGTPEYMAPELLLDRKDRNAAKATAWSLGVTVWEMIQCADKGKYLSAFTAYLQCAMKATSLKNSPKLVSILKQVPSDVDIGAFVVKKFGNDGGFAFAKELGHALHDGVALGTPSFTSPLLRDLWTYFIRSCLEIQHAQRKRPTSKEVYVALLAPLLRGETTDAQEKMLRSSASIIKGLKEMASQVKLRRFGRNVDINPMEMVWPLMVAEGEKKNRVEPSDLKVILTAEHVKALIHAPAGLGKSTLCKSLFYGWGTGQGLLCDEVCVIYVPLGQAMKCVPRGTKMELSAILHWYWRDESTACRMVYSQEEISFFLTTMQRKILLILDGVDDGIRCCADDGGKQWLKRLVEGEFQGLKRVLITARPEESSTFRGMSIEIRGVHDVDAFVKLMKSSELTANRVRLLLKENQSLSLLCQSPLMLQLVLSLYEDENKEPPPETAYALYEQVCIKFIKRGLAARKDDEAVDSKFVVESVSEWNVERVAQLFKSQFNASDEEIALVKQEGLDCSVLLGCG